MTRNERDAKNGPGRTSRGCRSRRGDDAPYPDWLAGGEPPARRKMKVIRDLGVCEPGHALSNRNQKGCWKRVPFTAPVAFGWQVSRRMPKPDGGVARAAAVRLADRRAGWTPFKGNPAEGAFLDVHARFGRQDGLVYLGRRLWISRGGEWDLALGHDGGIRLFVDGACVLTAPELRNPAMPGRSRVRLALGRGRHEVVAVLDLAAGRGCGLFFSACPAGACPAPAPARDLTAGTGLSALAAAGAREVSVPLRARGWHAVYLGLAGTGKAEGNVLRVKLTGDAAYQPRAASVHEEVLFKAADLTGRRLWLAQQSAGEPRAACLCYVRLVPLSGREVAAFRRDQAGRGTRRLIGTLDGFSFLHRHHPRTRADMRELFEPFRGSDFGDLWWQYVGADLVNYRSRHGVIPGAQTRVFPRAGDGHFYDSVLALERRGISLTRLAVEACRDLGIRLHVGLRPAAWKMAWPYEEFFVSRFYLQHPAWRCRDRDGTPAARMSFAVPGVRRHLLDVLAETLEAEPDGVVILYNRGVPLILWEDAFCAPFRERYGADARRVPEDDPRLFELRAEIMTQWMREVRRLLDAFRKRRRLRRRLTVSAMCFETESDNRAYGLDVARWAREGLVDHLGIFPAAAHTSGKPVDLAYYRRAVAGTGVTLHPGMIAWRLPSAREVFRRAAAWYEGGADGLLFWDPEATVADGLLWPRMRRMGHANEVRAWAAAAEPVRRQADILSVGDEPPCRWSASAGF
jgi:hypothetical protein